MKKDINAASVLWRDQEKYDDQTWNLLIEISERMIAESRNYIAPVDDEWLNSKQAAQYLKVSVAQLHNLTSAGQIPHYKMGRANRYQKSELREFLLKFPRGKRRTYDQV